MEKVLNILSHSPEETLGLANKLVNLFTPQDVLVLKGPLGSGKTVFVRGLAKALGLDENKVNSPSFTIVNEYPGDNSLYHFDLYRLADVDELIEIGWDEYMNREGLMVVEWGEKAKEYLPNRYYELEFKIISETEREINISFQKE
jgi:tRNA threonylcarbamoyladenosine biosynthesis protein TsaE